MALVLNEEQVLLRDSAAGFLAEKATVAHQRALRDGDNDRGFNDDVWREMAQMGWAETMPKLTQNGSETCPNVV